MINVWKDQRVGDLGVIIDRSLKLSEHCNKVANSANVTLGMINPFTVSDELTRSTKLRIFGAF